MHPFLRERFQNTRAEIKYIARTYIDILFSTGIKLVKFWVKSKVCLWLSPPTGIESFSLQTTFIKRLHSLTKRIQTSRIIILNYLI